MNKISTLTAALLLCGATGAMAQTTESTLTLPTLTTANDTTWYVIKSYNRGGVLSVNGSSLSHVDYTGDNGSWCFIAVNGASDASQGVHVLSRSGKYLRGVNASTTAGTFYVLTNPYNTNGYMLSVKTMENHRGNDALDANVNNTGVGAYWPKSNDNEGTTWVIEKEDESSTAKPILTQALETALTSATTLQNTLNSLTFGSDYGQYNYPTTIKEDLATAIEKGTKVQSAESFSGSDVYWAGARLNSLLASGGLNMPAAGSFLRIKSKNTGYYFSALNATTSNRPKVAAFQQTADNNTVFYYDGSRLTAYANGYQLYNTTSSLVGYAGATGSGSLISVSFHASANGNAGYYSIYFDNIPRELFCYNNTSTAYSDVLAIGTKDIATGTVDFSLEAVTTLPVTVTNAGFSTLNLPVAVTIPTGVKAYTAERNGDYLVLTALTGTIPANTPVVLEATANTYDFAIASEDAANETTTTSYGLTGTIKAEALVDGSLTLQNIDGAPGFYTYTGTEMKGFKAYVPAAQAAGATALRFNGSVTGIEGATANTNAPKAIYDLQGRRVSKLSKGGVFIIDGQKVLVK